MVAREEALEEWDGVNTAILLVTIVGMPLPDGVGGRTAHKCVLPAVGAVRVYQYKRT